MRQRRLASFGKLDACIQEDILAKQRTPQERNDIAQHVISAATNIIINNSFGKPQHEKAVGVILGAIPDLLDPLERLQEARAAGRFSAPASQNATPTPNYIGLQLQAVQLWSEALRAMAAHPQHVQRVDAEIRKTIRVAHAGSLLLDTATKTDAGILIANAIRRRPLIVGPGRAGSRPGATP